MSGVNPGVIGLGEAVNSAIRPSFPYNNLFIYSQNSEQEYIFLADHVV